MIKNVSTREICEICDTTTLVFIDTNIIYFAREKPSQYFVYTRTVNWKTLQHQLIETVRCDA